MTTMDDDNDASAVDVDRLLPFLSTKDDVKPIVDGILSDGYYILRNVLSDDECSRAVNDIWDFVEDTSNHRVRRNDPSTWYPVDSAVSDDSSIDDPFPYTGYKTFSDMFQSNGAGWVLGEVRTVLAERVFEVLYDTNELHSSKEGFTFHRPTGTIKTVDNCSDQSRDYKGPPSSWLDRVRDQHIVCGKRQQLSNGEHFDQTSSVGGLQTIQSLVALEDQQEGVDGHFLCWPGSHKMHRQLTKDTYRGKFSWIPLTDEEIQQLSTFGNHNEPTRVYLKKGDVVLWRSDLAHAAVPPQGSTARFRAVAYTCMQPASMTPSDVLSQKMDAYKQRQTGDHRPHVESWHQHRQPNRASCGGTHRRAFRCRPPFVTIRQAQLYGLLPYSYTNKDMDSAIVRGVRFVADDTHNRPAIPTSRPCHVRLETLHPTTELTGQDKYLGGVPSPCGRFVYGVPGTAKRVLRIDVQTGITDLIGPSFDGKLKWLRGVDIPASVMNDSVLDDDQFQPKQQQQKQQQEEAHECPTTTRTRTRCSYPEGCCLALPSNATSILKIDPVTHSVTTFGQSVLEDPANRSGWSYHGGQLASNGMVYAIPANAKRVLKICPRTEQLWVIGPSFGNMKQKWFGGIMGSDGCVYGIPHNASGVLKIDPTNDSCTVLQLEEDEHTANNSETDVDELTSKSRTVPSIDDSSKWKWHGGVSVGDKIYGYPNNSSVVLVVNVPDQRVYTIDGNNDDDDDDDGILQNSGRHRIPQDGRYKYLGGAASADNSRVYLFPCDAERVLRIDVATDSLSLIGPPLLDGENKFQNGFAAKDGCMYGIPQRAMGILKIDPETDDVDVLPCEGMIDVKDKFEGGVLAGDGCIYCMPLRAKSCVKVVIE